MKESLLGILRRPVAKPTSDPAVFRPMPAQPGFRRGRRIGTRLASGLHPLTFVMIMPPVQAYRCISPADAVALLAAEPELSVFDVRDLATYRLGHLPDAAHLTESRLPAWFGRLDKDRPILIYCYKGHASRSFAQMFADFRFTRVFSVDGGYEPLAAALAAA